MPAWWGGSFSVSAEVGETDLGTPAGVIASDAGNTSNLAAGACTTVAGAVAGTFTTTCAAPTLFASGPLALNFAKSTAPDLTAAYYIPQPWGHFDVSAVVRPGMDVSDGKFLSRSFVGYGGHIGMDIKPGWFGWAKDDLTFHITAGDALGGFLNASTNFGLATNFTASPATAAAAAALKIKPTTEFGGNIGYQHWWADNLRSNVSYGINHHDIPAEIVGAAQAGGAQQRADDGARQRDLEPGLVCRCRLRIHVGPAPGGQQPDRPDERADQQVRVPLLSPTRHTRMAKPAGPAGGFLLLPPCRHRYAEGRGRSLVPSRARV